MSPTLSSSFRGRLRRSTLVARPEGVRLHRFSQGSECGPVWCRGGSLISPPRRALSEHQLDRCCRHFILPSPISPSVESSPVLVPRYNTGKTPGFVIVPREQPRRSLPSTRDQKTTFIATSTPMEPIRHLPQVFPICLRQHLPHHSPYHSIKTIQDLDYNITR